MQDILHQASGFQIDSRKIEPNNLFFALPGEKVDGHTFLREVRRKGGLGAIVLDSYQGPDFGLALIRVEDVGQCLRQLAQKKLESTPARVVAITGSLGKTTTKEFTASLLEDTYRVGCSWGNQNTKLTLPLALLNGPCDREVWVLEMGASEPGDLARLIEMAPPEIAVCTKVSLSHAAFFRAGLEGIAQEKRMIFSHPRTRIAIFDYALKALWSEFLTASRRDLEQITFSIEDPHADYYVSFSNGRLSIAERGMHVASLRGASIGACPQFLHNLAASIAIARQLRMEWGDLEEKISRLHTPKMRFELFRSRGILCVNDAYNANPESMRAALSHLPSPDAGGQRIAVLASMNELGPDSAKEHWELGQFAGQYVDCLLTWGVNAEKIHQAFAETKKPTEHFVQLTALAERLALLLRPGDVLLCKGSRSMELEKVFSLLHLL